MSAELRRRRSGLALVALISALALTMSACSDASGDETAAPDAAGKVTVAGDSISLGVGTSLRAVLDGSRPLKVIGESGTGLARPDSFDWPTRLEALARDFPPEVLVLSLGSNDAQDLMDVGGDPVASLSDGAAWEAEYSARLARSFDAFEGTGTTVLWLGHVRTAEDRVGLRNRRIHDLAQQVAAERDWVVVADLAEILGSGEQVASDCLRGDGLHLTTACLDRAAAWLAANPPVG